MITLVIIACAAVIALALVIIELVRARPAALDTERQERWLVRHAPQRLQPILRHMDCRVAGGIMVATGFVVVLACALVVGWLLDSIDRKDGFARWDDSAARWGAENATPDSTQVIEWVTELGSSRSLVLGMTALGLVVMPRRGWGPLGYLAVVGLGASGLNNLLKMLIDRERPDIDRLVGISGSSFPSGHSAAAAACWMAIALVLLSRRNWRWRATGAAVAAVIAVAVAASRVLLGVHWLTDVIAGVMVGWTWFLLSTIAFGGRLLKFGEPAERIARGTESPTKADVIAAESSSTH